jgi:hypothetical protein
LLAVEDALAHVVQSNDLSALMYVYVHALDDMERAAALYAQHAATHPEVQWAARAVAKFLANRDPVRAAATYFEEAEQIVPLGGTRAARMVLVPLENARNALISAGLEDEWQRRINAFIQAHRKRRTVIAALKDAYEHRG